MSETPIFGFITVRSTSTRLPGKCFLPFGEVNVLTHVIRRTRHFNIKPIVCTSVDPADDKIAQIAKNESVQIYRGPLNNKLRRWANCALQFNIKSFHTIDADDPFFDGEEIKKSIYILNTESLDMVYPSEL
ncbi:MAG: hypothetical protein HQK53_00950, partial [Oligoflexia bacterium]|nr:hypothetical protein [Oligoflexia bacterium]